MKMSVTDPIAAPVRGQAELIDLACRLLGQSIQYQRLSRFRELGLVKRLDPTFRTYQMVHN
jgi:hypothetical protein